MTECGSGTRVRLTAFEPHADEILSVRRTVFVLEQRVPEELEVDGRDPECVHALVLRAGTPVATGRLFADGHIGRVAVLREFRGRGLGCLVMQALIGEARRQGLATVELASQVHAAGFYERLGFTVRGEPYMEAGIPHVDMSMPLA